MGITATVVLCLFKLTSFFTGVPCESKDDYEIDNIIDVCLGVFMQVDPHVCWSNRRSLPHRRRRRLRLLDIYTPCLIYSASSIRMLPKPGGVARTASPIR